LLQHLAGKSSPAAKHQVSPGAVVEEEAAEAWSSWSLSRRFCFLSCWRG